MIRQILCGFTLLAFVNLLMGCTSVEKVPVQEAERAAEKITELVLIEGDLVQFNKDGAIFLPSQEGVLGSRMDGNPEFIPLSGLRECRISPPQSVSVENLGNARIAEVVLKSRLLVGFQPPGAVYDSAGHLILGTKTDGTAARYPLGRVASIRTAVPASISVRELQLHQEQTVYEVVENQGVAFTFGPKGGHFEKRDAVFTGTDWTGTHVDVPASSVLYARVTKVNAVGTILAVLGVTVGVVLVIFLIALATKQSCPFIYSFNGEQYVFDAEPLGGAICPGLARADISRLDHLKAADGEYRLLVRNEVAETQYIDFMKLLVVDHPAETAVYPDLRGKFYGFRNVEGVTSATDEHGMSLMKFLRASDNVAWQTHLASASKDTSGPVRHELTVTLPKPPGARRAWLVTNIGTSSWGSNMIRKTVEYRGNTAAAWLKSITPGSPSYVEMYQFIDGEEMYNLKVWEREGGSWKQEAVIQGQGPLISEDRVYPMDVSNAAGDSLVLRFNPPKGFWTFDYIGVSYEDPLVLDATRVGARSAEGQPEDSIAASLDSIDQRYYVMPEVGDQAAVRFPVPAQAEGTARSVYVQTSGYYDLHLPEVLPDQLARLYYIGTHPGQIVRTAMEEYRSWQAEQQAQLSRP